MLTWVDAVPSLSKEKHLWAPGGTQRWTAFPSDCVFFNVPPLPLFKRPRPSGAERWAQIRKRHDNVGFINITLAWCRKRSARTDRSAALTSTCRADLAFHHSCSSLRAPETGGVRRGRQPGHPVHVEHRAEWPVRSLPFDFGSVVNVMSLPAGDHRCPQLFSLEETDHHWRG